MPFRSTFWTNIHVYRMIFLLHVFRYVFSKWLDCFFLFQKTTSAMRSNAAGRRWIFARKKELPRNSSTITVPWLRNSVPFWWFCVIYLLSSSHPINSQYSSHCHFNQLCSCRVVQIKRENGYFGTRTPSIFPTSTASGGAHSGNRVTNPTYSGQFGIIIPE